MREPETCSACGHPSSHDQLTEFEDQMLCSHCLDHETTICSRCGNRIWSDDNAGDTVTPLCQSCYERFYTACAHCGRIILEDDTYYEDDDHDHDDPLCWNCYSHMQEDKHIHDYYYKPEPIFYGEGSRYFGVELEIDGAGEYSGNACQLMRSANCGRELIYCKHDGSLEEGFEVVTHPMTLDFHQREMPWAEVAKEAISMGYTSHQAGTCGLHIHVNREAFGGTEAEQDAVIARILYFFEKFWDELLKFSRRPQRQLDQWASRYGYKDQPKEILEHAKKECHAGRYTCVNLTNTDTIEFRIFRGTLKLNTLIATLQLVDKICNVALFMSDNELRGMSWTTFMSGCQTPELVQYLKERRLYVNEPILTEEEV